MAIQTSIQPFTLWRNVGFGLLCLVFALWGWYDYEYKIPRLQRDSDAHEVAKDTRTALESPDKDPAKAEARLKELEDSWDGLAKQYPNWKPLESAAAPGKDRLNALQASVLEYVKKQYGSSVPARPAAYDRPMQLWLYIVGCGVLGVPMFAWPLLRTSMRPYRLDDEGTLHTPDGVFDQNEIVDIDMSRWCSPTGDRRSTWTARAILKSGKTILLDDHDHRNMHRIIGAIAHRLYPEQWTAEARRVEAKPATDADTAGHAKA